MDPGIGAHAQRTLNSSVLASAFCSCSLSSLIRAAVSAFASSSALLSIGAEADMSLLSVEAWAGFLTEARADRGLPVEVVRVEAVLLTLLVVDEMGVVDDLEGVRLAPDGEEPAEEREAWPGGEGFLTAVDMADVCR